MTSRLVIRIGEPDNFSPAAAETLRSAGDVVLEPCDPASLPRVLAECDVFWFRLGHRIDSGALGATPRCRLIACPVTGLDHIDLEACRARGVRVVSLRGETSFLRDVRATAELTIALALALLRHVPAAIAAVHQGEWNRDRFRGGELCGRAVGIVGVGRLGSIVARYCQAFGARVFGYDPRADLADAPLERMPTLESLLEAVDLATIHVSYDASTHHLFDHRAFARMKPGSLLINTSRGGVIDEVALLDVLESGRLAGAALDVLQDEPNVGVDHPLVAFARKSSRLIIVPHIGGNTFESFEKVERFLADRVVQALQEPR
jgi:D-3-phosphoglycerate dehydrogenase / 2-oxoglutarate reductase